jgi:hypothetical protein
LFSVLVTFLILGLWAGQARRECCAPVPVLCVIQILCARPELPGFAESGCSGFTCCRT